MQAWAIGEEGITSSSNVLGMEAYKLHAPIASNKSE